MKNNKLTAKQRDFCKYYRLYGKNGAKAARMAGYSEKAAKETASYLLTLINIQEEIRRVSENIEETVGISKEMVIGEHIKLAFSSIAHLHNTWMERKEFEQLTDDQKACISEITTSVQKKNIGTSREPEIVEVEFVKIKLYDKQKSLDSISKIMGYDAPAKQELSGSLLLPRTIIVTSEEDRIKLEQLDSDYVRA